jgi:hypothetical protein
MQLIRGLKEGRLESSALIDRQSKLGSIYADDSHVLYQFCPALAGYQRRIGDRAWP